MKKAIIALVFAALISTRAATANEPILKPGDSIAICGDSITEQQLYSVYIEEYLLMCRPDLHTESMQFGWSGERADTFLVRMKNDVLRFKPSVATICYGMNDGRYVALDDAGAKAYRDNLNKIVKTFAANNVRLIVGSPGCVDSHKFNRFGTTSEQYNKTLAAYRDIAREIAAANHLPFADIYDPLHDVMDKAKAKWGETFPLWDTAGIHPVADGHLVMAYAFLKAMGINGNIGTITVDLAANKATATDGHTIKSFDNNIVAIESTRYPFCFLPDGHDPEDNTPYSMRSIIQFFPFNDELNRFTLVVKGAKGDMKVTWGSESKTFPADRLAAGINLAAEFMDNPFLAPFEKVHHAIVAQQAFEIPMIHQLVNGAMHSTLRGDAKAAFDRVIASATEQDAALRNSAEKTVVPVTHTLKIEPAQ